MRLERRRPAQQPALLLLLLLLPGCAPAHANLDAQPDPFTIGLEELQSGAYLSAYDAVEELRPLWMRTRSPRSLGRATDIEVYLDRVSFGTLTSLMSVPTETIEAIEWVDAASATQRWGRGHTTGVIAVRSRR